MTAIAQRRRDPRRPAWQERPKRTTTSAKSAAIVVILLIIAFPLYSIVLTSFSNQAAVNIAGGMVVWPHGLTISAYRLIEQGGVVGRALLVSIGITAVGTAFSMVVTVLASYGLSRPGSFGHKTLLWAMMLTMFFSGGIIPLFLVVSALGGFDQYWALILPSAVSVFNIIVMRAFFMNIASDMIESARIDGAGDWRILWKIVLPTSKAVTAVIALFYGVAYWNAWFNILLFMPAESQKWPLQMVLYSYVTEGNPMPGSGTSTIGGFTGSQQIAPLSIQMAVVTLTIVPILIVYPFVQKHFTKGVLLGAIKGLCHHRRRCRPDQPGHSRGERGRGGESAGRRDRHHRVAERQHHRWRLRGRAGVQSGRTRPGLRPHRHRRRLPMVRRHLGAAAGLHQLRQLERPRCRVDRRRSAERRQGVGRRRRVPDLGQRRGTPLK
jgi:multiple sugar transport system permease protein/putative aldouronate transport system permease protein